MGMFNKFKKGLTKTRNSVFAPIAGIVSGSKKIDEEILQEVEEILIMGDVGMQTTSQIISNVQIEMKKLKVVEDQTFLNLLKNNIENFMVDPKPFKFEKTPYVILVVGVNGTGKTTTIGKLAKQFKNDGKSVLLGAADTFRAAAIEQLDEWAQKADVEIIKGQAGSDPASIAFNTVNAAISRKVDVAIIDTAGRLHTKINLMEELAKIKKVIQKQIPDAPHETLLVLDGTTGQNAISQAKKFVDKTSVSGIILTKLDGTAKGGVAISISNELQIPVQYIGLGEGIDDLQLFDKKNFVDGLFS